MDTVIPKAALQLEMVNSITHGVGVLFGIASIPLLTALATRSNNIPGIVGACVYGFCFLMLFTFSMLYHGFQQPQVN
jgi:hemolysin III